MIGLFCFVLTVLASPFKRRSLVKFSETEASDHAPSLAEFIITTPELKFSVHTGRQWTISYH
jgi:hypothetical protein